MEAQVKAHYNSANLNGKIYGALKKAGKNVKRLKIKDLAPIDQLHTGGSWATIDLIKKAELRSGSEVLDAGCGIGGSSRLLAKEFGHIVTGIDLTDQFVKTAQFLTEETMLSDQVHFHRGSILDMPFESSAFDAILCQHVLVNISEKQKLFKEFHRVLKDNGKLILHEIVKGEEDPIHYPVPWAEKETTSFLEPLKNLEVYMSHAGFEKHLVIDTTTKAADWWTKAKIASQKNTTDKNALGPRLIFGQNAAFFGNTMSFNFKWNRIKVVEAVFKKV
ncbi:MAG: class I SAM-dependent methyltransferase [Desulfobacteraceae bacterium]|nr:class I SAM-dependent methyltransferase [Desulfobacteraceae bacterium]